MRQCPKFCMGCIPQAKSQGFHVSLALVDCGWITSGTNWQALQPLQAAAQPVPGSIPRYGTGGGFPASPSWDGWGIYDGAPVQGREKARAPLDRTHESFVKPEGSRWEALQATRMLVCLLQSVPTTQFVQHITAARGACAQTPLHLPPCASLPYLTLQPFTDQVRSV